MLTYEDLSPTYTESLADYKRRVHKLFETVNIKIDSVVSDLFSVTGRNLIALLCNGSDLTEWAAVKKKGSYYRAKYYKLKARHGAEKAIVAIVHRISKAIYHIIKNGASFTDLGEDYLTVQTRQRAINNKIMEFLLTGDLDFSAVNPCVNIKFKILLTHMRWKRTT